MNTDQKLDQIINKLIDIDLKLNNTVNIDTFDASNEKIINILDQHSVILQRLDQERHFTNETIKRIQKQLDEQQKDLDHVKKVLKIS